MLAHKKIENLVGYFKTKIDQVTWREPKPLTNLGFVRGGVFKLRKS